MPTGEMARWTIEAPTSLEFDDVTGLRVRLIAGSVAVLATDGNPLLDVSSVQGDPLASGAAGGNGIAQNLWGTSRGISNPVGSHDLSLVIAYRELRSRTSTDLDGTAFDLALADVAGLPL